MEIAKELGVDMIVWNPRPRRVDRLFFGSVANEVVKSAKCPVMTIRPSKKPE
ncbi:MAG: universal stress protein [Bilophila wadsworthia]